MGEIVCQEDIHVGLGVRFAGESSTSRRSAARSQDRRPADPRLVVALLKEVGMDTTRQ